MSAISEDGRDGPSFGLGICLQHDGHVRAARVKPDDVVARRAGARKNRADGKNLMEIFADSVCGTGNMHGGFPTIIGTRVGRDQALLGGFALDVGSRAALEKLP